MKKIRFSLFLLLSIALISPTFAQNWGWGNGVKGEGPKVEKDLNISSFSGFKLKISADVILRKGSTQSVSVKGQKNIIDLITTKVSGDNWEIGFEEKVGRHDEITIYITVPTINYVGVSGSGDIEGKSHFTGIDKLEVKVSGSGDIELEVSANEISTGISGSGDIELSGETGELDIRISGSGDFDADDMVAKKASVRISGSGDCDVNVQNDLEVRISGSGDVTYKGNPSIKTKVSGSGDVNSRG